MASGGGRQLANVALSGCVHAVCQDCFPGLVGKPAVGSKRSKRSKTAATAATSEAAAAAVTAAPGTLTGAGLCPLCRASFAGGRVIAARMECSEEDALLAAQPDRVVCYSLAELAACSARLAASAAADCGGKW